MPNAVDEFEYNVRAHRENARTASKGQYKAALAADKWNYLLGLPAVVLGTLVSTSIFATLDTSPNATARIAAGLLALVAAALAAAQTFFNFSARAKSHRAAGAQYGDVRRRCELMLFEYHVMTDPNEKVKYARQQYAQLLDRLADLAANNPDIADKYWESALVDNRRRDADESKTGMDQYSFGVAPGSGGGPSN